MGGIAGWIDFDRDMTSCGGIINGMSEALCHRGLHGSGIYVQREAALVCQSMASANSLPLIKAERGDTYALVYDGNIYNADELRGELQCLGYNFTGNSDAEVLLASYIEWQDGCLDRLNGVYAFAVWKERGKSLFLARDRIGVKPLYFYKYNGGLIFASEIKSLLKNPSVPPVIDEEGLRQIFLLGPGKISGSGIFKGIKELQPAQYSYFDKDKYYEKNYWKLTAKEHGDSLEQTVEKTRFLITDAVKRQLLSDTPLSCFLSGGLDSSIICMVAAEIYSEKRSTLTTFSVDYEGNGKYFKKNKFQPEADGKYILIMRDFIKSRHTNIVLDNKEIAAALGEAALARDLPGMADIDSSLLLFCRKIKQSSGICVSGECADELFGGYPWYHIDKILFSDTFPWSRSLDMRLKLVQNGVLKGNSEEFVREQYMQTVNDTDFLSSDTIKSRRMREMFMLNYKWFMQTLLDRSDRMGMQSGLEIRVPYCDHRIVEYAYNMPWDYKALKGREKGIVREAFKELLPDEIVWRKKSPYPKTHNPVYLNLVKEKLTEIMQDKKSLLPKLINRCYLKELFDASPDSADPWYGQLMRLPQVFAYLIQIDAIFKEYKVIIE